jgi:membrane-associated HD superfamily phosphohydrolase
MVSKGTVLSTTDSHHPATKIGAKLFSYIFHPLFIPVYVILFLIFEIRIFPDRDDWQKKLVVIQFLVSYTFLPLVTILLMKGLGFIQSIHLKAQKDRILPYIVCEIYYFWIWHVSKNLQYSKLVVMFALAIFLACSLGLIFNAYIKISMHGISVGVLSMFVLLAALNTNISFGLYVAIAFLIAGLTCTARLIDSDHSTKEIYAGFFVGATMQLVAYWFV